MKGLHKGVTSFLQAPLALFFGSLIASAGAAVVSEEVPVGFLPLDWVTATLQKTLSPQGRSVLVTPTGPVRIADEGEKVAAARRALEELQKAPALVPIDISFVTTARRVVQRLPVEAPVAGSGIPVPNRYDPPRIMVNPGGGVTVIPSQPRNFGTRNVGPGAIFNPAPTSSASPEARLSEATATAGMTRRFSVSTVPGKPVLITVLRQVPDAGALRTLALKHRAIPDTEPAWVAAGTELLLRPELSGGALVVNIVPQILLPAAAPGQEDRHIPLSACAAGVMVARGAPSNTGILPRTDPEFYRVFLGAQKAENDTFTALTVTAEVQYIGGQPK
ncbi:MAG: hypothetical protein QOE70_1297 [Chthoniobacter sp.]|jgi:hypothetical protein|nr:hypothetical protein [Chthoniobacter sp.]